MNGKLILSGLKEVRLLLQARVRRTLLARRGARALFQATGERRPETDPRKSRRVSRAGQPVRTPRSPRSHAPRSHRPRARVRGRRIHLRRRAAWRGIVHRTARRGGGREARRRRRGRLCSRCLEPPASFEESAAVGAGMTRSFSVRARAVAGPRQVGPGRADRQFSGAGEQSAQQAGRHHGRATPDGGRCGARHGIRTAEGGPVTRRRKRHRVRPPRSRGSSQSRPLVVTAWVVWGLRGLDRAGVRGRHSRVHLSSARRRPGTTADPARRRGRIAVAGVRVGGARGVEQSSRCHADGDRGAGVARSRAARAGPRSYQAITGLDASWTRGNRPLLVGAPRSRPARRSSARGARVDTR